MKPNAVIHLLVICTVLALPATLAAQLEIEYLNRPNQIIVSWPSAFGTALEETLTLSDPESWKPIERKSAVLADRRFSYTKRKIEPEKFFRLQLATGEFSEPVL